MLIFGADIGCRNLSYCIIEHNDDSNIIKIIEWGLINLCSDDNKCCKVMRNGKICDKIAHYYDNCKINNINKITDGTQVDIHVNHYCTSHKTSTSKRIKVADTDNLYDHGNNMYDYLNKHPLILTCDKFVIENQPSMKNPKMKSIAMLLYSYFVYNKKSDLTFIHPTCKLKICSELTKIILKTAKTKTDKYKITKNLGIEYTQNILDKEVMDPAFWLEHLYKESKKDDLCDAFLHAYFTAFGKDCKNKKDNIDFYDNICKKFNVEY